MKSTHHCSLNASPRIERSSHPLWGEDIGVQALTWSLASSRRGIARQQSIRSPAGWVLFDQIVFDGPRKSTIPRKEGERAWQVFTESRKQEWKGL